MAGNKVYWKAYRLIANELKVYSQRYDLQLKAALTPQQYACIQSVLTAILTCLETLPQNPPIE